MIEIHVNLSLKNYNDKNPTYPFSKRFIPIIYVREASI